MLTTMGPAPRRNGRARAAATALLGIAIALPITAPAADAAGSAAASARYRISYGNIPVGHADTSVRVEANGGYGIGTTFSSGGIAKLLKTTEGRADARGSLGGTAPTPDAFSLAYRQGDRQRSRDIAFSGGGVASVNVQPAKPIPNPATAAQLARAIDPASALLVRAPDDGAAVCNRTVPVFDGRARLDLRMAYRTTAKFRAKGWRGKVHVCSIAMTPIAGVKPKSERAMREMRGASVAFAQLPGTDAWLAVELTVPASIGTVTARATRLDFGG